MDNSPSKIEKALVAMVGIWVGTIIIIVMVAITYQLKIPMEQQLDRSIFQARMALCLAKVRQVTDEQRPTNADAIKCSEYAWDKVQQ